MSTHKSLSLSLVLTLLLIFLTACGNAVPATQSTESGSDDAVTTITVWDYYGEASPITPLVEPFEAANPDIKVNVESLDWDTTLEKLNVILTGGTAPDVVTLDMTWLPTFAPLGAFTDLSELSGGELNGVPLSEAYSQGALEAISYNDQTLAMLYDFDVYALYYRADLFEEMGLEPPTNWDELNSVAAELSKDGNYRYAFLADTFHSAQWIYENGGSLLNDDYTEATFNSPEAVEGIEMYAGLLANEAAYYWSPDEGWEITSGLKDDRLAMFSDGAYYMGIMKDAAPEMSGKWKVTAHPAGKSAGSYMGGTGLVIPAKAAHQEAAWRFIEFAMTLENQIGVFEHAGAAPALLAALESDEVNQPDPYFGDQKTLAVFLEAMETARPFPYVRQWNEIDSRISTAMEEIALGQKSVQEALDDAAAQVNDILAE